MALTSSRIGMVEITCEAATACSTPPWVYVALTARPPATSMRVSRAPISSVPPAACTLSAQISHIIPGPYLGYWNSSMRVVMSVCPRLGRMALTTALRRSRFLTRWAAQSAGMSETGTPHTFSVYVLKNVR